MNLRALFAALWTVFSGWLPGHKPAADPSAVTILTYHTFDSAKKNPFTVSSKMLREQMRYLHVQKIPVIPLSALEDYLYKGIPVPDHSVVITVDDGYKTAYTIAAPIFKEFGFPWTEFVYPQFIGKSHALTWEQVRALAKSGVDIQSHSFTHPLLTHPPRGMTKEAYDAWLSHELLDSKKELEKQVGKPVPYLAYPFGGYDERVVEATKRAGYKLALTCDDGNITHMTEPLHVNRRLVYRSVKLKEFTQYFPDRELRLADLTPRDGERLKGPLKEIRGRILNVDQILPDSLTVLVDKVGRKAFKVKVDAKTGTFLIPLPENQKHGYYFISLFAHDKSNPKIQREGSWIFILRQSQNISKI